jgi:hypothetical protein
MSALKTQHEVATEFLENLIIKSDDELIAILGQNFTAEDYGDEDSYNLDTLTEVGSLFDLSDNSKSSFQVLAVLCATNKEKSFEKIKNHYEEGTFTGVIYFLDNENLAKVSNNQNFAFNISFNKIDFKTLQQGLKVIGETIWIDIPKDYFKYGWNDALSNSGASISSCSSNDAENCSNSSERVTISIPLEALKDKPNEDFEF